MKDTKIDVPEELRVQRTLNITIVPPYWEAVKLGAAYTWGAFIAIGQLMLCIKIVEWFCS